MSNGNLPHSPTSVEPHATISAQDLAQGHPDQCGFLRKRGQKERVLENLHLSRHVNWRQRFVAIQDGCCYCYADEVAKVPLQSFSLQGYNRIFRSKSDRAAFVFTVEPATDCRKKVHTFAATSDADRISWMRKFKEAMMKANNVSTPGRSNAEDMEDTYEELEKLVYEPRGHRVPSPYDGGDESSDDDEEVSSDDSDYALPNDDLVSSTTERAQRRNVPLPPVPQEPASSGPVAQRSHPVIPPTRQTEPAAKSKSQTLQPAAGPLVHRNPASKDTEPQKKALTPKTKQSTAENLSRRLSEKDCFLDNNDRETAIEILRERRAPGTFLIRKSRQGDSKVLVVMTTEDVKEYKIFTENHQVTLDKKTHFSSVDDLLDHYNRAPLPNRQQTLTRSFSHTSAKH